MLKKYKLSAAAISAILIGGGLYFYQPQETPKVEEKKITQSQEIQGFGVIDFERLKAKHPDGEELKQLQSREKRLKLELEAALTPYKPPQHQPEIEEKPFEEASKEKNMQQIMEKFSALKAKKLQLAEQFTADSREEYLRRRDAVRNVYLNAALNITLKLENADNLRLTPEEIAKLQSDLDEITKQRNSAQREMLEQWTAEINQRVEAATAEEEAQARAEAKQLREQSTVDAENKIREVEERNKALTEKINGEIESRQKRRRELAEELQEVSMQVAELENKIFSSIVENAGKLGALYRLENIFVKREIEPPKNFFKTDTNFTFDLKQKKNSGGVIYFSKDVTDLTKELIKEMELKGVNSQ